MASEEGSIMLCQFVISGRKRHMTWKLPYNMQTLYYGLNDADPRLIVLQIFRKLTLEFKSPAKRVSACHMA